MKTKSGIDVIHLPGPKTPFLFIHSMWGRALMFEKWLSYVNNAGHAVYALDLRGRGDSRPCDIGSVSLKDYIEDALDVVALMGEQPVVVGHSMGGLIAQSLAFQRAARTGIFVSTIPPGEIRFRGPIVKTLEKRWAYFTAALTKKPILITYEDVMDLGLNAYPNSREIYDSLVPDSGLVAKQIALGTICIPRLPCPSLVVFGSKDKITPPDLQISISKYFGIDFLVYEGLGHLLMLESEWEPPIRDILRFVHQNA